MTSEDWKQIGELIKKCSIYVYDGTLVVDAEQLLKHIQVLEEHERINEQAASWDSHGEDL